MGKTISILWISPLAPYNAVKHAGGKTHNYYTKSFGDDERFAVTLVTWCSNAERAIVEKEFSEMGIKTRLIIHPHQIIKKVFWKLVNAETTLNPFNRYAGYTKNSIAIRTLKKLKEIKKTGFCPDVVFLHWTHINLLSHKIVQIFPESKVIEMEVDVAYQGYQRHLEMANSFITKGLWNRRYQKIKRIELQNLMNSDGIIVNNRKDARLLKGINKPVFVWSPYFQSMLDVERNYTCDNRDIIFYGAMDREENWKSALWFIENVLPSLDKRQVRFIIIGNRPPEIIRRYESERIKVLGFVEDITPYFSTSLCLVAPLVLGAGIKVKVLEGLSSGIPVLTNQVGIEGIPAKREFEYFHCETAADYVDRINDLLENEETIHDIEKHEKEFIRNNYNITEDAKRLHEFIINIANQQNLY